MAVQYRPGRVHRLDILVFVFAGVGCGDVRKGMCFCVASVHPKGCGMNRFSPRWSVLQFNVTCVCTSC